MWRGPDTFYDRWVKRVFDLTASGTALVVLSPVLVGVAIAVRRQLGSPVLFRQQRTGRGGKPFDILKFRTMTDQRDERGQLLPDKQRLAPLGRWLRRTSLDELPELINVVRGEMSLVGPRPLLHRYLERYDDRQAKRHECRPGLTGWVAVNGRNTSTWPQRFELDIYYVDNLGPWLDLLILVRTVKTVFSREGIDPGFADQMPEFQATSSS
jgi:lipopolysaccharide/colanic/teichoic acid biosynthesis glycosyltransferase